MTRPFGAELAAARLIRSSLRPRLRGDAPEAVDRVLDGVRLHFEKCIEYRACRPIQESLMGLLDAAIERITTQHAANVTAGSASSERLLRDALHALVGLRLSLFPASLSAGLPHAEKAAG